MFKIEINLIDTCGIIYQNEFEKKTPNPNTLCILKSKQKQAVEYDNKQKTPSSCVVYGH